MEKFYNIEEQRFWNRLDIWSEGGHEWSKSFGTTENLWNNSIFEDLKQFRNKAITEIAPGHGRITQFLSILTDELTVIDLNETCIDETRKKLGSHVSRYIIGDGKTLNEIDDNSQDLVFSFDSFVHMHANVIESYIKKMERVLRKGGHFWIHHSNWLSSQNLSFQNVAGRSSMTPDRFNQMSIENGFEIITQKEIQFAPDQHWSGIDFISFYKKVS